MSVVGFSSASDLTVPSQSIWGDCPNTLLRDKGLGLFGHEDFQGNIDIASFADKSVFGSGVLGMNGDTGVIAPKAAVLNGVGTITTGSGDNNAIALFSPLLGSMTLNSGVKLWTEARFEFTTLFDGGLFFGFGESSALVKGVIANDPSNSAVATTIANKTVVGFVTQQAASAIATMNAVYQKTTGTQVNLLSNVSGSSALQNDPSGDQRFTITAATSFKLGLRFDGRKTLTFYANGYKVAAQNMDSTLDQSSNLGVVLGVKTGTAAAKAISVDWLRYAVQNRS